MVSENCIMVSHVLSTCNTAMPAMLTNAERQHATAVQTYNIATLYACYTVLVKHCQYSLYSA